MLAVAKSGHLDSSLSAADIVAALYYRVLRHDPERPGLARARPLRALQGPRGADPVRGARPARLLPARGPDGAAQDRRPASGPPRHAPHRRGRGLDRLAGPGALDVPRDRAWRCASTVSTTPRTSSACSPTATARRARPGRRRPPRPTSGVAQPDRDRRLQPPADRRHHRGGHGHRRRARQVRGLRLGRGRDRRPRHGRRWSRRSSAAARSTGRRRSSARPRRARASRRWRAGSASTARPPQPGARRRGARGARGAPRGADQGRCTRRATRASSDERAGRGRRPSRPRPAQAYGDALADARRASTTTSSPSTPTSPCSTQSIKFGKRFPDRFFNVRRRGGEHDVDGLRPGGDREGPLLLDLRDLRLRPRLRPGPARDRPQRAQGADRRLARRRLARRGRRLAPDDRGHRADAGDAADAGRRAGRLQPGLPRGDRQLRGQRRADVHALRPPGDADRLRARSRRRSATAST